MSIRHLLETVLLLLPLPQACELKKPIVAYHRKAREKTGSSRISIMILSILYLVVLKSSFTFPGDFVTPRKGSAYGGPVLCVARLSKMLRFIRRELSSAGGSLDSIVSSDGLTLRRRHVQLLYESGTSNQLSIHCDGNN